MRIFPCQTGQLQRATLDRARTGIVCIAVLGKDRFNIAEVNDIAAAVDRLAKLGVVGEQLARV